MAFKFDGSEEGFERGLDLFKPPPVNTAVYKREWVSYRPVSQITKGSPIQFTIPGTSSDYKDLKKMMLYLKCRIKKQNGTPITKEDSVGFCNLTLHTLFRQVDFCLQQMGMTSGVGLNYPYKAMMDTLLQFEEDTKETYLGSELYYKDSANYMDDADPQKGGNLGLMERSSFTENGQYVDLEGPLYIDVCQQERFLVNGVQTDVKLIPSSDSFALMSPKGEKLYTYEIAEAVLKMCQVKLNPGVMVSHAEVLKKSPALYPYTRSDVRTFNIQPGSFSWGMDDIFQGQIPSRVVIGLVSAQAYSGVYSKSPYNFQHFNCNFVGLYADGQSVPGEPYQCDYKNKHYVSSYLSLFSGIGKFHVNEGNYITREEYPNGYCLYLFDIAGSKRKDFLDLTKKGHTRLNIRFEESPSETVTVVVYSCFPSIFQIDESRNIVI